MKNLQKLLIIIILSLGFYSCGDHRLSQTLADIESYIDSRPDSAGGTSGLSGATAKGQEDREHSTREYTTFSTGTTSTA